MNQSDIWAMQQETCAANGTAWYPSPAHLVVGVARNVRSSTVPVNGLRHPPQENTTGWYIWAGEGDQIGRAHV